MLVPLVAQIGVFAFGPGGSLGAFHACAVLLTLTAAVFAFLPLAGRETVLAVCAVAVLGLLVHGVAAGFAGAPALGWLVACVGGAVAGAAAFGDALGNSRPASGAVAALLLCTAMTATFWADDAAAHVPAKQRQEVRQAIVHIDPLMAAAYGAADHDRLHDADVYNALPLASALIERPSPLPTGALWLAVGLALAGAAWVVRFRRPE